ncbi:hypothetical protein SUGI_0151770 [Cryptomeria japonica]|nr:hypothetical protein SUGI_0151770 [Cryptomeria japonica]
MVSLWTECSYSKENEIHVAEESRGSTPNGIRGGIRIAKGKDQGGACEVNSNNKADRSILEKEEIILNLTTVDMVEEKEMLKGGEEED